MLAHQPAWAAIHLGCGLLRNSSSQPGRLGRNTPPSPQTVQARRPYLALLQVGFAMRALLPEPRCALAAPFHPCLCPLGTIGGILSVALSLGFVRRFHRAGVTRHHCFMEPGLSSNAKRSQLPSPLARSPIVWVRALGKRSAASTLVPFNRRPRLCHQATHRVTAGSATPVPQSRHLSTEQPRTAITAQ